MVNILHENTENTRLAVLQTNKNGRIPSHTYIDPSRVRDALTSAADISPADLTSDPCLCRP